MNFELFPLIFLVIGLLTAGRGLREVLTRRRFEREAARADGRVTDVRSHHVRRSRGAGTNTVWTPVVRFETADGRTVEAEVADSSDWGGPETGALVEVFYDPADPTHVRLELGPGGIVKGAIYVAFGAVFAVVGLTMLV